MNQLPDVKIFNGHTSERVNFGTIQNETRDCFVTVRRGGFYHFCAICWRRIEIGEIMGRDLHHDDYDYCMDHIDVPNKENLFAAEIEYSLPRKSRKHPNGTAKQMYVFNRYTFRQYVRDLIAAGYPVKHTKIIHTGDTTNGTKIDLSASTNNG